MSNDNYETVVLKRTRNKQFSAAIVACNGEIRLSGEPVQRRATLKRSLDQMIRNLAAGRIRFVDETQPRKPAR